MALPLFTVTLFLSAFVLFLVQPMIGNMILPRLGGTPQVWNTCMVFFQMVLLAGYAYTHTSSSRLKLRTQLIAHAVLLLIPFAILLPYGPLPVNQWSPPPGVNPIPATLLLLATVVGIPFFVISTSAPLLQRWFAYTGHPSAKDPYFLYGASNLGSMLALLLYPVAVEPLLKLNQQAWTFTFGYAALVVCVLACVGSIWGASGRVQAANMDVEPEPASEAALAPPPAKFAREGSTAFTAKSTAIRSGERPRYGAKYDAGADDISLRPANDEVTLLRKLRWIGLAAVPSSLMLGVTTHITTDLSPIPLFWVIPLALYLLSFILVFMRWPVVWTGQPHRAMLFIQPIAIVLMIFMEIWGGSSSDLRLPILFDLLAFFATALVCHGELAKDRPGTKGLTEFYLMMSVGGMLGGMFNGLVAPILFVKVWEYSIAVIVACLLRPKMREGGWSDDLIAGFIEQPDAPTQAPASQKGSKQIKGGRPLPRPVRTEYTGASESLSTAMDFLLPFGVLALLIVFVYILQNAIMSLAGVFGSARGERDSTVNWAYFFMFGIPLIICLFYYGRPIRFGLSVAAVLIISALYQNRGDGSLYSDRSYFGIISVKEGREGGEYTERYPGANLNYTQLIHGHINHGMNFLRPGKDEDVGKPKKDFSRLPTTYYHRLGPAGIVMEKFNWFHDPENSYASDARLPASLVGQAFASPYADLVAAWSEPAYATIGLGTGTMACYGRPYQPVDYYEIDNHIRRLSLPPEGGHVYFTSLQYALDRGSKVIVRMGDARLRMARAYANFYENPDTGGGPDDYYHMMVVDAFSSDAIPKHLLTREAFQMYFQKLTTEGILCVHTSNRFVDLPKVVADVATSMGYDYKRGHDQAPFGNMGQFTSEWVMVARDAKYLTHLLPPEGYNRALAAAAQSDQGASKYHVEEYWSHPLPESRYIWTDDYSNLWAVVR